MINKKILDKTRKLLKQHNQSHLLAFWQQLNDQQQQSLLSQIQQLDFQTVDKRIEQYVKTDSSFQLPTHLEPALSYPVEPVNSQMEQKYQEAVRLGKHLISTGRVGAFVVAGGQGTRLGFDGPKGNFPISPVKNKTLFEIFAETIAAVSERYNAVCPWYIMTSPFNYQQTLDTFCSSDYFGLKPDDVFIFQQETIPNFDFDGKILLSDKATIACSPDGHGGSIKALYKSGAVNDMKKRGIEFISYWQVDNPLINIFDPLFIGLHALDEADMSSKALIKAHPKEKVGNFCLVDGRVMVIEYSDLPDKLAEKRNADGSLTFELGSIAIHIINRGFIEKLNSSTTRLPFHKATKKIPYVDSFGNLIKPEEPNGVKLECFIFDALPLAKNSVILQTFRSEEFAPVKNADGSDSPQVSRKMMVERWAAWLEAAGAAIPRKPDGSVDCLIEISPSFALEKDDIKAKLDQIPEIKPMDRLYLA